VDQGQGRKERDKHGAYNLSALTMSLSGSDEELDMIAATNSLGRRPDSDDSLFVPLMEARRSKLDETRPLPFAG
jgi:hypothetical protein